MNLTALQEQPMPNFAFTMEVNATAERLTEMTCTTSTPPSVSVFLKPGKVDDCSNNQTLSISKQTGLPVAFPLVKSSNNSTKSSYTSSNIIATLENESVWSRFHCLGTEMILTKQGRRMFPCCRFRLSGLDLERKYTLVMDIMPLDAFTHKWNGKTWEPAAVGEPPVRARVCVHPESPAFGHQWMESPVSFYKVKLTCISTDQDGCVFLYPMHRYQPRLHVVPVDPDSKASTTLDSPNVQTFTFPKTEFYAVTSYQNPQITQLKIDCNPFAMAFRKDSQSIRLLQDKLGLCSPGGTQSQPSGLNLSIHNSEQNRKECTLKDATSPCTKDHRESLSPGSSPGKEREGILIKMKNAVSGYLNGALCKEEINSNETNEDKEVVKQSLTQLALDEHLAPLDVEPSVTAPIQEPSQTMNGSPASSNVVSREAVHSQLGYAHGKSPTEAAISAQVSQGRMKPKFSALPKPRLLNTSQVNRRNTTAHFRRKPFRRARKARSKWWSSVRYSKPPLVIPPPDVSLQPDLEDVEGMLFVSFAAKQALDVHVQNMKPVETSPLPLPENQSDVHAVEDVSLSVEERISKLESTLLLHLKQQKHRQVIHPLLQEVGMKLSLLDPTAAIDLQYLGVRLPFPPPVHNSLNQMNPESISPSHDGAGSFVSRTGKTNDPTKIKGWRDKFSTSAVQSAPEGLRNHSAFCSDMLDEYLENEAQQISDRVAVFSKSSSTPVSYQLPSRSSSYVVTLDSLLKTRSTSLNKVYSSHANVQARPLLGRSPENSVSFYSEGSSYSMFENKTKSSNFARSFQSDQAISSTGPLPRLGRKNQLSRPQLRWSYGMMPAKRQIHFMLQDLEEEAFFNGKVRTHITTERANFALSSLVTSQKSVKRTKFSTLHHKGECSEEFCRLGCICDSLQRKIRGPTHCRREQCMFDCSCFKHKVLLIHPPKVTKIQRGRKRALMAFPIADPEKGDRPPPATSVTTLWKLRMEENDSEPLFIPEPAPSFKKVPRLRTYVPRPTPQMREEDKDPVYLYFESKMTCARVREYNSNPPPQVHMLPNKKLTQDTEKLNHCFEAGVPPTAQKIAEKSTSGAGEHPKGAPSAVNTDAPEPTKLLEILSECNWEPHRNLVLSSLFWRMSNNLLSEPFCVGMYRVQLLSTTLKRGDTCSTVTYKVCVSRSQERKATSELQPMVTKMLKTEVSKAKETRTKKGNCVVSAHIVPQKKSSPLTDKRNRPPCKKKSRIFPLLTHALPAGYLRAAKKKRGGPAHGLIRVNGKMYNQAKLLLGQMGALHPANRFAAFVTGRLWPKPPDQPKVLADVPKPCLVQAPAEPNTVPKVINISQTTPPPSSRPLPAIAPKTKAVSKRTRSKLTPLTALSKLVEQSTSLKEDVSIISTGQSLDTTPLLSAGTKLVNVPVPPSSSEGTPSETATTAALPPGQQVVLQHLPGVPGSNFFCQYNGQVIQLVPIGQGPTGQPQPCLNSEGSIPQVIQTTNTCLPKDATSMQKPLSTTIQSKPLPRPFPVIAPKIFSLSGSSGMNIASGTPAFNLQSSFSGKTGTFSFRICPPSAEGKAGSQQGAKPPDQLVAAPAALVLPGGFTLIKLPLGPSVPPMPADSTTTTSLPAELPQKDECKEKVMSQSCSPKTEQTCQVSESNTKKLIPDTSNTNSTDAAGLNHGKCVLTSESVAEDRFMEKTLDSVETSSKTGSGKYDWVPKGAEMVLKSDDCESEHEDMEDWPPKGAERVLWIEEDSTDEEEKEDFNEQLNNNAGTSVKSPAGTKAKNFKTTRALQDISEASQSSSNAEQKHMISTLVAEDKELVHDDSNHRRNHEQEPCLNDSSNVMKKEPNNKPTQTLSPSRCNSKKVLLEVNGYPTLTQTEPCEDPTEKVAVVNQPNVCEQGLAPKNSSSIISKTEGTNSITQIHTRSNHLEIQEQGIVLGNSGPKKILPFIKQTTNIQATVSNHPDQNKQNLNSNSSNIIHHEELSGQKQTESSISTSSNTNAVEYDEADEDNYVDIDGDVPCPLLEGQTPAISTPPAEHLPNAASKKTDLSGLHLLPIIQKSFSQNNKVFKFSKQLVSSSGIPRTANQVEEEDVPEKQKLLKNKWLQFQKADRGLYVDDEDDVTQGHLSDDGKPGNDSDSDSSEGSSNHEDDEEDSSSDEDSSDDSESTSNSETEESFGTSSKEDDAVDVESFEENQEKKIISKMKAEVRHYRKSKQRKAKRADKFRKKINHRPNTCDKMESENELAKRLTHTEKERVRRGEMRQSFASLKTALNVEEKMKMCKHDILIQARLMIRALEVRNQTLEERKKALLQRQSAYISTIAQLSGKTEEMVKMNFKENCEQEKCCDIQNPVPASVTSPEINTRLLDGEANQLPPRLGQWKSNNCLRQTAKKSSVQPSVTPSVRKRRKVLRTDAMEDCKQEKWLDVQNPIPALASAPQINPRRLDSEGNQLPPRLGLWKSVNYIRKRSKKSCQQPSITTAAVDESSNTCMSSPVSQGTHVIGPLPSDKSENFILKLVAQNPTSLPPVLNDRNLSADPQPSGLNTVPQLDQRALDLSSVPSSKTAPIQAATGPFTLPKIVLQSFAMADPVAKLQLTSLEKTPLPSSPQASESAVNSLDVTLDAQDEEAGTETGDSVKICEETEKSLGSEESNEENPSSSPPVNKNCIQNITVTESEKDKPAAEGLVKLRKKRAKRDVIIEDALSNPDALGPRMLRNRSPATNRMSTRSTPKKKR